MTTIEFFVPGNAAPGGSKTASIIRRKGGAIVMTRNGTPLVTMRDAGKNNKEWRAVVALCGRQNYQGPLLSGPLAVRFEFFSLRPQSHFVANDRTRGLRADAPRLPTKKPDVLKLARAVEDALTGIVWVDDCQTVELQATKRYADRPGCKVTVMELPAGVERVERQADAPLFAATVD